MKRKYWNATSTSGLPPLFLCSASEPPPPEKADMSFFLAASGESVRYMQVSGLLPDILPPWRPGMNLWYVEDGFTIPSLSAMSLTSLM